MNMNKKDENEDKNANKTPNPLLTGVPSEGVNELSSSDASLLGSTETTSLSGGVNAPSGADALKLEDVETPPTTEGAGLNASADDSASKAWVKVVKKSEKRKRWKERKRLSRTMSGLPIVEEKGSTEGMGSAVSSGETSNLTGGTPQHSVESRKRGRTVEDKRKLKFKKPRLGGLYSQAVKKGITLRVICKNDSTEMTPGDVQYITTAIEELILEGNICQVEKTFLQTDGLHIVCKDQKTMDWLKPTINQLAAPKDVDDHSGYLALGPGDRPPMKRYYVWFPSNREPANSLKLLGFCNPGLDTNKIAIKAVIPGDGGNTLVLGVATELVEFLAAKDFLLYCGLGTVQFREHKKSTAATATNPPTMGTEPSTGSSVS